MNQSKLSPYDWVFEIADPNIFAGRKDELAIIKEQITRFSNGQRIPSIAIIGERRVGKSSLLLRTAEICEEQNILTARTTLNVTTAGNPWEFWHDSIHEVIKQIKGSTGFVESGITLEPSSIGFLEGSSQQKSIKLQFEKAYNDYHSHSGPQVLSIFIVRDDIKSLVDVVIKLGYRGLLLILDEAHRFQELQDQGASAPIETKNQVREVLRTNNRFAIAFGGELTLAHMFNNKAEPFYGQANIIALKNFTSIDDIAECALLPLDETEIELMSPMTVDYLAKLSQGKPNQIRLICDVIYDKYRSGDQEDLNITIDILDDVINKIGAGLSLDYDLKKSIEAIRGLSSIDLEILYNMNRYPGWSPADIIDLDEAFRAEIRSQGAVERRRNILTKKREKFINQGIMSGESERFTLSGDEFLYLYLRFWYEIRKYGKLSRTLVLGKGPQTAFGEKTEKLAEAVAWELRRGPGIQRFIFHPNERERGEIIIDNIKNRCNMLNSIVASDFVPDEKGLVDINECFSVCELVNEPGQYYLLCLNVRNRDNPRELMQLEMYFKYSELNNIDILSLTKLMSQQLEDARIYLDGCDALTVELLDIPKLLKAIKGPTIQEILTQIDVVGKWHISSIQHILNEQTKQAENDTEATSTEDEAVDVSEECIKMYSSGKFKEAENCFNEKLRKPFSRDKLAKLFNDRGYVRHTLKELGLARKDLETTLDLHYEYLPLTVLNLSAVDIDENKYDEAIEKIEEALFLILSRRELDAAYLRMFLPECHLNFRTRWEQRPANLLEVAYINLAYSLLKTKGFNEAIYALDEGISILPSSIYLKHAKARYHLYEKKAPLANPIYEELTKDKMPDQALRQEIEIYSKFLRRRKKR